MKLEFAARWHTLGFSIQFWNGKPYKSLSVHFLFWHLALNWREMYKKKAPTEHEIADREWDETHPNNEFSIWAIGDATSGIHSIRKQIQDALNWTYGLEEDLKRAYTTQQTLLKDLEGAKNG